MVDIRVIEIIQFFTLPAGTKEIITWNKVKSCTKFMCKTTILISSILFDEVVLLCSFKVFKISIQLELHQGIKKAQKGSP